MFFFFFFLILQSVWLYKVGFFIPVSSLKVFGHSIHSERRIYLGKSIQALQNDTLSYHDYSVSGSSSQHCSGIPFKFLCLFSSIFVHYKNFPEQWLLPNQYRTHMTFSHKIQAKIFPWCVILCSIDYIDAPNKGIEQACSRASCDIHISPFSIILHFSL